MQLAEFVHLFNKYYTCHHTHSWDATDSGAAGETDTHVHRWDLSEEVVRQEPWGGTEGLWKSPWG